MRSVICKEDTIRILENEEIKAVSFDASCTGKLGSGYEELIEEAKALGKSVHSLNAGTEAFEALLKTENLEDDPSALVHIGPDRTRDFLIPLGLGITAVRYPSLIEALSLGNGPWKRLWNQLKAAGDPFAGELLTTAFSSFFAEKETSLLESSYFPSLEAFARLHFAPLLMAALLEAEEGTEIPEQTIEALLSGNSGARELKEKLLMFFDGFSADEGAPVYQACLRHIPDTEALQEGVRAFFDAFRKHMVSYAGPRKLSPAGKDLFAGIFHEAFLLSPYRETRIFSGISSGGTLSLSAEIERRYEEKGRYPDILSGTGFADPSCFRGPVKKGFSEYSDRLGIHIHLYHKDLYQEFFEYLKDFPYAFDLYVTVVEEKQRGILEKVFTPKTVLKLRKLTVLTVENRGRDVAPWIVNTAPYQKDYDLFCHLHGKRSAQYEGDDGDRWRHYLLDNLVTKEAAADILNLFHDDETLGCVFPNMFPAVLRAQEYYGTPLKGEFGEDVLINRLLNRMGFRDVYSRSDVMYSAGTMLWYRPKAFRPLFDLGLRTEDFPAEPVGPGGTLAHAIERIVSIVPKNMGYDSAFFNEVEEEILPEDRIEKSGAVNLLDAGSVAQRIGLRHSLCIVKEALRQYVRKKR